MRIKSLHLENFRSIKELTISLDGKDAAIYGENGLGKTTIANAICWVLTGTAITQEKDFNPQTVSTHNLHHKATMVVIKDDGEVVSICKDYYEKWTKKKGSSTAELTGRTTDIYINDVPTKAKEFDIFVEGLCGGTADKIKILLILGYFTETLKMDDRRKILFDLCKYVSDAEILEDDRLKGLADMLKVPGADGKLYEPSELKQIAAKQKTKLNAELKAIPERIDELTKQIPDMDDDASLEEEQSILEQAKKELLSNPKKAQLEERKAELQKEMDDLALRARLAFENEENFYSEKKNDLYKQKDDINGKIFKANTDLNQLKNKIIVFESQRNNLLKEWKEACEYGKWDEAKNACPTCGQEFPIDVIEQKKAEARNRAEAKKTVIRIKGQECSDAKIQQLKAEAVLLEEQIEKMKAESYSLGEKISEIKAPQMMDYKSTDRYIIAKERLDEVIAELEAIKPNKDLLDDINARIEAAAEKAMAPAMRTKLNKRIGELEEEKRKVANLLEQAEKAIFLCEEYTRIKVATITDSINQRFKTISFLLFREQINGGLKECCEPLIKNDEGEWVEFKSANTAAQVNAGIEIANVLADEWGMNIPVIIDKAESVCTPTETNQQMIRLVVSGDDKNLRIKV